METSERDIWSSPDLESDSPALPESKRPTSQGFFADDLGEDIGWGLPTPSPSSNALEETTKGEAVATTAAKLEGIDIAALGEDESEPSAASQAEPAPPLTALATASAHDAVHEDHDDDDGEGEDDFADFDDSPGGHSTGMALPAGQDDDDFGDFGDFPEDGQPSGTNLAFDDEEDGFGDSRAAEAPVSPLPSAGTSDWPRFTPAGASSQSIATQINSILSPPLFPSGPEEPFGAGQVPELSQERIRQAEGPAQILVGESSRQIYADLVNPPPLKPVDWLRSRTRRDLHISLGVPINLDEIMYLDSSTSSSSPGGSSRRLPPLAINLNNGSDRAPRGGPDSAALKAPIRQDSTSSSSSAGVGATNGAGQTQASGPRSQSRDQGRKERIAEKRREDLGLGPLPEVDMQRVEQVSNLSEDQLSLLTLPSLRSLSQELSHLITSTSLLLTHHLTLRESLQADSEMYNGLIKDLVTGAASRIGDSKGGGAKVVSRQSSGRRFGPAGAAVGGAGSGRNSPRPASPFSLGAKR
ncbi:hypothetical protein BCV69DRAFT_301286 [Microstroma glucosiphilum]|uniref:Uncharacterized protein n=1 Tax=Pseudomicrostroma glucosiphilum TaxID=1684307 RepID=A0A316TZT6_9BASI|nr:hypothetical protein BCV69DRAFT_301286 [Pseudomicrostroma glucosiphilum]PWN18490.1 hypothetical protein BCV69DRAFT_301286 [Pseudomicrostroma glucosiphilum]